MLVKGFALHVYTTKTGEVARTLVRRVRLRGDSPEGDRLLSMFIEYAEHAAPRVRGEPLFGVVRPYKTKPNKMHTRYLARKDISDAIKYASDAVGLPAERFSTHSLCKGKTTAQGREGVEPEGRWAPNSAVPGKHYRYPIASNAAAHVAALAGVGRGALRSAAPTKRTTRAAATK